MSFKEGDKIEVRLAPGGIWTEAVYEQEQHICKDLYHFVTLMDKSYIVGNNAIRSCKVEFEVGNPNRGFVGM